MVKLPPAAPRRVTGGLTLTTGPDAALVVPTRRIIDKAKRPRHATLRARLAFRAMWTC